jgi:DHA1 family multidrug resistance protein-like MFS transporter
VRQLGISDMNEVKFWSSIVFAGPYVLSIILVPVWGKLGDRYGRKMMLVRSIIGLSIAMFLMGFAQNVVQLFLLRVLQGAVSGFIASSLSFVSAETPVERTGFAMSLLQSAQSAGNIIGPFAGGVLSDLFGIRPVFFVVALLCLVSGILVIAFVRETNFKRNSTEKQKKFGFKNVWKNRGLRLLLLFILISQAGIHFTSPVFPFFIEELNIPEGYLSTITGFMVGIVGILSIIFAPKWGRRNDKKDFKKTLSNASLIVGASTILQLIVNNWLMLIPFRIIIGIFIAAIIPTLYSTLSKKSDQEHIGETMGFASSANLLGALISFLLCSYVSSNFGIEWVFIISGLMLISVPAIMTLKSSS